MKESSKNNERFLSPNEIAMLLNFSVETDKTVEILIGSPDDAFVTTFKTLISGEGQFSIERTDSGCDTLVQCAQKIPDILILDEQIGDISCDKIISCIKRNDDLKFIKILCVLKSSCKSKESSMGADSYLLKTDIEKVHLIRAIRLLLNTSEKTVKYSRTDLSLRKWPRTTINISAKIELFNISNPQDRAEGEAIIENISQSGAFLSEVKLDRTLIPDGNYRIRLHIEQPPLKGIKTETVIVRFYSNDSTGTGIKFAHLSEEDKVKILKLFVE